MLCAVQLHSGLPSSEVGPQRAGRWGAALPSLHDARNSSRGTHDGLDETDAPQCVRHFFVDLFVRGLGGEPNLGGTFMRHKAIQPDTGKRHHWNASIVYERELIVKGTRIFLDRGWPSGQFTASMARRAGEGIMPEWYENSRSEHK